MKSKIILAAILFFSLFFSILSGAGRNFIPEPIPLIFFGAGIFSLAEFARRLLKDQT